MAWQYFKYLNEWARIQSEGNFESHKTQSKHWIDTLWENRPRTVSTVEPHRLLLQRLHYPSIPKTLAYARTCVGSQRMEAPAANSAQLLKIQGTLRIESPVWKMSGITNHTYCSTAAWCCEMIHSEHASSTSDRSIDHNDQILWSLNDVRSQLPASKYSIKCIKTVF